MKKQAEGTRYVVKSNELNEKSGKLALNSQKLVCIFISLINTQRDNPEKRYTISFSDIFSLLGMDERLSIKEQLTREIKRLNNNSFWLDEYTYTAWVSQITFNENGTIEFEFPDKLHRHLFNLKKLFVKYRLGYIIPMKSVYSIRLYELCKQWQRLVPYETNTETGKKKYWESAPESKKKVSVDTLRKMLNISDDKWKLYAEFKRRIILPSLKEINSDNSDIKVAVKEIKLKGSKLVTDIEFSIYNHYVKIDDFFQKIEEMKERKERTKGLLEVPNKHLNSGSFNAMYKAFIDHIDKYPAHYTFELFLQMEFPEARIVAIGNGGKDLKFQRTLFNQIQEEHEI